MLLHRLPKLSKKPIFQPITCAVGKWLYLGPEKKPTGLLSSKASLDCRYDVFMIEEVDGVSHNATRKPSERSTVGIMGMKVTERELRARSSFFNDVYGGEEYVIG